MSVLNPSAKKFAVLIGINYRGTDSELNGCINDAIHLKAVLTERFGYSSNDMLILVDDDNATSATLPTRDNIEKSFNLLVEKANQGYTELWFSYSGHGSYYRDTSGDEDDGRDEVLCPVDCDTKGMIVDDYIHTNLVARLPAGVNLFCLIDACHSGTIIDLPYLYSSSVRTNNSNVQKALVCSISGCRDDQTSADAYIGTDYEGAMTWSFLKALHDIGDDVSLKTLVDKMRSLLAGEYTQVPMLALCNQDDLNKRFFSSNTEEAVVPVSSNKSVTFELTADRWYWESSWNIMSVDTARFVFDYYQGFSSKGTVSRTVNLKPGNYELRVRDTYGDGGVGSRVVCDNTVLLDANMTYGKIAIYPFVVR